MQKAPRSKKYSQNSSNAGRTCKRLCSTAIASLWCICLSAGDPAWDKDSSTINRMDDMLKAIETSARLTSSYTAVDKISRPVLAAIAKVDRSKFVPERSSNQAFENHPLGIGYGQTISQPFIVALMTHLVDPQPGDRILEIGTGSGYQAAIAAELVAHVYSIEIVPELAHSAERRLESLGYTNVSIKTGDGWYGWPEEAPFDGILVTAVGSSVPPQLLSQLANGGKLIMPLGDADGDQELTVVTRDSAGDLSTRNVLPVRFVPMTGEGILTLRE